MKLDPFEGNYASNKGKIAHTVLEHLFKADFDFEKEFDTEMSKYEWTNREKFLLKPFKSQLKMACDSILRHNNDFMNAHQIYTEKNLKVQIEPNAYITGFIDKLIVIEDKYLFVIDYKTGSETFDASLMEFGFSLQLPTYAYLLQNTDEFKNCEVSGLYINAISDSSLKVTIKDDEMIPSYLKLNGITVDDKEVASKFDNTINDGNAKFIGSYTFKKDGSFNDKAKIATKDEINEFAELTKTLYMDANFKIRSNEFSIAPKVLGTKIDACKNCPFRDICYLSEGQKIYLMAFNWSDAQKAAIKAKGVNTLVSAGAGSGKTAVLTERIYSLIKDGARIDKFLVLTFTNAAAAEMKARVRKKLLDDPSLSHLAVAIENSHIETFDAFNQFLVKKYAFELEVSQNFGILDGGIIQIKASKIVSEIFDKLYEMEDEKFLEMVSKYCIKDDNMLKNLVLVDLLPSMVALPALPSTRVILATPPLIV